MKKRLCFLLIMCVMAMSATNSTMAQSPRTIEVGPHIGVTSYIGDLTVWRNLNQWDWKHSKQFYYDLGGVVRYNYDSRWSFRFDYTYLQVRTGDPVTAWRPQSFLNFKTTAHDISLLAEFNVLDYYTGKIDRSFSPFIFGGISGLFYYVQPYTGKDYIDVWHLNELYLDENGIDRFTVEVERGEFNPTISIPFGVGLKASLSKHLAATIEWRMHYTFTDYFDGVSGNYSNPDEHQLLVATKGKLELPIIPQGVTILEDFKIKTHGEVYSDEVILYNFDDPTKMDFTNPVADYPSPLGYQRGNARNNDWFGMVNFTLTWKFVIQDNSGCKESDY